MTTHANKARTQANATDVFYTLADGTKGSYRAPTSDISSAIEITREQLLADAVEDGVLTADQALSSFARLDVATITKAQVLA